MPANEAKVYSGVKSNIVLKGPQSKIQVKGSYEPIVTGKNLLSLFKLIIDNIYCNVFSSKLVLFIAKYL